MTIVNKPTLSRAFRARLGMTVEQADLNAERVLDVFGFESQVIDNVLDAEERQFFYLLQESGLFTTRSEETDLYNGQSWRTHYWLTRPDRIRDAAREAERADAVAAALAAETEAQVYADLPAECWVRA